jgi:hypothetical protein
MSKCLKYCMLFVFFINFVCILHAEEKKVILINQNNKKEEKICSVNEIISIHGFYYFYQGENEIHYRTTQEKLYVNGKLVAIEVEHENDFEMLEHDTIYYEIEEPVDLSSLKHAERPFYLFIKTSGYKNEQLQILSELKNIYYFSENSGTINDEILSYFKDLKKLQYLIIRDADVTNTGISFLKNLNNLKYVDLRSTKLTDDGGLDYVAKNTITYLDLGFTKVNDCALKYVKEMKELEKLSLEKTDISDEGLKHISKLINLRVLILDHTNISNNGLQYLKNMKNLEVLNLEDTEITNDSLIVFERFKKLNYLNINYTKISFSRDEFKTREEIENYFNKAQCLENNIIKKQSVKLYKYADISNKLLKKLKMGDKIQILSYYKNELDIIGIINKKTTITKQGSVVTIPKGKECIIIGVNNNIFEVVVDIDGEKIIVQLEKKLIDQIDGFYKIRTEERLSGWILSNDLE